TVFLTRLAVTYEILPEADIRKIFDATAGTLAGDAYYRRWTGHYLANCRELVLLAGQGPVVGYLMGCYDSMALADDIFYIRAFTDLYATYPAHFHVNLLPAAQGRGVGRTLIEAFLADAPPTHVVTGERATNRAFYSRLGFVDATSRYVAGRELVLLGRA
ncbi:MAG: GNAT family N-acetyltransferase, partial [Alphaproteobacteria bacterium]|nr:GNAT family N-acetyltransferase [Alphaproteobacteria bacterium]